jgi:hypothetical protein
MACLDLTLDGLPACALSFDIQSIFWYCILQVVWASSGYSIQLLVTPAKAVELSWREEDALFSGIADWAAQPIELRHPFTFYYGHVAAFFKHVLFPQVHVITLAMQSVALCNTSV